MHFLQLQADLSRELSETGDEPNPVIGWIPVILVGICILGCCAAAVANKYCGWDKDEPERRVIIVPERPVIVPQRPVVVVP